MGLRLSVVTPEETAIEAEADFLVIPFPDGEKGIGNHHSPLIARLGYGELRYRAGGQTHRYYVDGGFAQVRDNAVVVLTGQVVPVEKLDRAAAQRRLDEAMQMPIVEPEMLAQRDRLVEQARAQLRLANR